MLVLEIRISSRDSNLWTYDRQGQRNKNELEYQQRWKGTKKFCKREKGTRYLEDSHYIAYTDIILMQLLA